MDGDRVNEKGMDFYSRLVDALLARGSKVLDAGCGGGRVGGHLHQAGHRVIGLDLDPVLIAAAEDDYPGPVWAVGDLAETPFPDSGFDAIVCAGNVMGFLAASTRRTVLTRFAQALSVDGRAVIAFGADRFIDASDRGTLRQVALSFDVLLWTAGGGMDWDVLLGTLRKRGTVVLVGFPDVEFNSTNLVARELTVAGSFLGSRATMREMLAFAQEHGIAPEVELLPMSQANEAICRVREGRARYRVVLVNDAAQPG